MSDGEIKKYPLPPTQSYLSLLLDCRAGWECVYKRGIHKPCVTHLYRENKSPRHTWSSYRKSRARNLNHWINIYLCENPPCIHSYSNSGPTSLPQCAHTSIKMKACHISCASVPLNKWSSGRGERQQIGQSVFLRTKRNDSPQLLAHQSQNLLFRPVLVPQVGLYSILGLVSFNLQQLPLLTNAIQ